MMQAGKDYGVEVILAYEQRRVGQIFFPPALLRDTLVQKGLVRRVAAPAANEQQSTVMDESQEDAGRSRRKQGRLAGIVTK